MQEGENIVTFLVTVDGYWIGNWIYCTLQQIITTENLNSSTNNSVDSILLDDDLTNWSRSAVESSTRNWSCPAVE
jgi:hypothetical protein